MYQFLNINIDFYTGVFVYKKLMETKKDAYKKCYDISKIVLIGLRVIKVLVWIDHWILFE